MRLSRFQIRLSAAIVAMLAASFFVWLNTRPLLVSMDLQGSMGLVEITFNYERGWLAAYEHSEYFTTKEAISKYNHDAASSHSIFNELHKSGQLNNKDQTRTELWSTLNIAINAAVGLLCCAVIAFLFELAARRFSPPSAS